MNKNVAYFNIKDTTKLSCHFCSVTFVSCINLSMYLYLAVLGRGGYVIYVTPVRSCLSNHTSLNFLKA